MCRWRGSGRNIRQPDGSWPKGLVLPLPPRERRELPELLHAVEGYAGSEHTRLALQLMVQTFVRPQRRSRSWHRFRRVHRQFSRRCCEAREARIMGTWREYSSPAALPMRLPE
jgi:hypothetical protein